MARKLEFPVKKLIGFDEEMMERIDQWRATQRPLPNPSEAIRALIDAALKKDGI